MCKNLISYIITDVHCRRRTDANTSTSLAFSRILSEVFFWISAAKEKKNNNNLSSSKEIQGLLGEMECSQK